MYGSVSVYCVALPAYGARYGHQNVIIDTTVVRAKQGQRIPLYNNSPTALVYTELCDIKIEKRVIHETAIDNALNQFFKIRPNEYQSFNYRKPRRRTAPPGNHRQDCR
jgi:hypothetical protein